MMPPSHPVRSELKLLRVDENLSVRCVVCIVRLHFSKGFPPSGKILTDDNDQNHKLSRHFNYNRETYRLPSFALGGKSHSKLIKSNFSGFEEFSPMFRVQKALKGHEVKYKFGPKRHDFGWLINLFEFKETSELLIWPGAQRACGAVDRNIG